MCEELEVTGPEQTTGHRQWAADRKPPQPPILPEVCWPNFSPHHSNHLTNTRFQSDTSKLQITGDYELIKTFFFSLKILLSKRFNFETPDTD